MAHLDHNEFARLLMESGAMSREQLGSRAVARAVGILEPGQVLREAEKLIQGELRAVSGFGNMVGVPRWFA